MVELLRNTTLEEVMMKNRDKEEVMIRSVTEEVRGVSSVTYDLTLVCKGGAKVRIRISLGPPETLCYLLN